MRGLIIPVIAGPTASGKTAVAVELAKRINGEIISADSMQVYKHLSIGTAKPTAHELMGVPCHLIDHVDPNEQYKLGRFVPEALACIDDIQSRGHQPIVCGGTGLYIRGLLYGIHEVGGGDSTIRRELADQAQADGLGGLFDELCTADPVSAARYGPNDRQRILRALEVFRSTGTPLSAYHEQDTSSPVFDSKIYVLSWPREQLYNRINQRVDAMPGQGLVEEISNYLEMGYSRDNPAINALGYKELIDFLHGRGSMTDAIETMKQKSRNYAKRQETWFRAQKNTQWIECAEASPVEIAAQIFSEWEKLQH